MKYEKVIIFIIQIIFAGAAIWEATQLNLLTSLALSVSLALTYIPWGYTKVTNVCMPKRVVCFYDLFLFGSQFLGTYIGFYGYFFWWDRMLHLVSGLLVGYFSLVILATLDKSLLLFEHSKASVIVAFIFCSSVVGAVLWEIIEFTGDKFLGTHAQLDSLQDTMEDLICGTIIGGCFALYIGIRLHRKQSCCVDVLLELNKRAANKVKHK